MVVVYNSKEIQFLLVSSLKGSHPYLIFTLTNKLVKLSLLKQDHKLRIIPPQEVNEHKIKKSSKLEMLNSRELRCVKLEYTPKKQIKVAKKINSRHTNYNLRKGTRINCKTKTNID